VLPLRPPEKFPKNLQNPKIGTRLKRSRLHYTKSVLRSAHGKLFLSRRLDLLRDRHHHQHSWRKMNFAYADPPYLGQGKKLYGYAMWDDLNTHGEFIKRLHAHFPDGWALSASSPSLPKILPLCPPDVRIGAWVKPFAVFKPNVNPAYAWEPVIFRGGRKRDRKQPTVRDWCSQVITLKKGLTGAKPEQVCEWIIQLLGARRDEDTFKDIFPGTGVFGRVWGNSK
jgi:hypothetical protein